MAKLELPKTLFLPLGDLLFQKYKDSQIRVKEHFKLITNKAFKKCNLFYAKLNSVLIANINLNKNKIVWVENNSNFCVGTDI